MLKYVSAPMVFFVCMSLQSSCQVRDSLLKAYNSQTIYRSGTRFIKGNNKFDYHDLRLEFTSPATVDLYNKSKRRLSVSRIFNVASLAVIVTSVFTKTSTRGSVEFAAGTGILGLCGFYFQNQSSKYLDQAIWERNKEVLFGRAR
jgi:hypothetical protein